MTRLFVEDGKILFGDLISEKQFDFFGATWFLVETIRDDLQYSYVEIRNDILATHYEEEMEDDQTLVQKGTAEFSASGYWIVPHIIQDYFHSEEMVMEYAQKGLIISTPENYSKVKSDNEALLNEMKRLLDALE